MAKFQAGEIAVELAKEVKESYGDDGMPEPAGPRNSYFFLRTFGTKYRGRWRSSDAAGASSDHGYMAMPAIPGIHIIVNQKKRTIRAVDPLAWPEHEKTLAQANKIRKNSPEGVEGRAWDESRIENATDTEMKTCLFELREFVDNRSAVCHTDNLPSREEIMAMEGNILRRVNAPVSRSDGTLPPAYATEEELARMGQPQENRVKIVPAKAGA